MSPRPSEDIASVLQSNFRPASNTVRTQTNRPNQPSPTVLQSTSYTSRYQTTTAPGRTNLSWRRVCRERDNGGGGSVEVGIWLVVKPCIDDIIKCTATKLLRSYNLALGTSATFTSLILHVTRRVNARAKWDVQFPRIRTAE
jgi:hypothetical protein